MPPAVNNRASTAPGACRLVRAGAAPTRRRSYQRPCAPARAVALAIAKSGTVSTATTPATAMASSTLSHQRRRSGSAVAPLVLRQDHDSQPDAGRTAASPPRQPPRESATIVRHCCRCWSGTQLLRHSVVVIFVEIVEQAGAGRLPSEHVRAVTVGVAGLSRPAKVPRGPKCAPASCWSSAVVGTPRWRPIVSAMSLKATPSSPTA